MTLTSDLVFRKIVSGDISFILLMFGTPNSLCGDATSDGRVSRTSFGSL